MFSFQLDMVSIVLCTILGVVACVIVPMIVDKVAAAKSEKYGRELSTDNDRTWKSVLLRVLVLAVCIFFGLLMTPVAAVCASIAACAGITAAAIDLKIRIIPNEACIVILVAGLGLHLALDPMSILTALASAVVCALAFGLVVFVSMKIKGSSGIGAGDFKFIVAMAFALGWPGLVAGFAAMAVALLVICAYELFFLKLNMATKFPMCPALCVGLTVGLVVTGAPDICSLFL